MTPDPDPSTDALARRFVSALQDLERDGDVGALVELYGDDAASGNVLRVDGFSGPEGAREFWTNYREQFGEIASEFANVIVGEGAIALEWSSTATMQGRDVAYRGVTVLEVAEGLIRRSCAYFDPTALT